jgi:hypothetical protein
MTASLLDVDGIMTAIKSGLDSANTTTADFDLSSGLTRRVGPNSVLKVNIDNIQPQLSFFPCITVWLDSKEMEQISISRNAINSKRKATLSFNFAGIIWNNNMISNLDDPSSQDCVKLMENLEINLRNDITFGDTVNWNNQVSTDYFTQNEEETHFRVGIMKVDAIVFY